ncbi:uncharacterized protein LOC128262341 isoform X2 [Drosophila gunungcola]|uniref:uncharacterized protein LOC128262341 isoform X2 n=1 Tax=Drosophila gunungcola TaxID=103775 RepID=UPI0022DF9588|nr:uncharacterized protein LOC128262341 isoform X2 [Drosophila gunungcola]
MSCCGCGTQTPGCCECPPGLRLEKTPQAPFFDTLGPYPDEVIMTILDRILYLSGATKIIPMLNIAGSTEKNKSCSPPPTCVTSPISTCPSSSAWRTCCSKPSSSCCTKPPSTCSSTCRQKFSSVPCSGKSSCIKSSSRLSAVTCCPRQRTPRVDFDHPAENIPMRKKAGSAKVEEHLKRSISETSLACQHLKAKLTSQESPKRMEQKWLWTRLIPANNGCMVYEVYKDSNAENSPSGIESEAPIIVFLVMPNGYIMPFESTCNP